MLCRAQLSTTHMRLLKSIKRQSTFISKQSLLFLALYPCKIILLQFEHKMKFPYLLYPKIATVQSVLTSQTNLFNVSYVHFDGETAATLAVRAREKHEAAKLAPQ